MKAHLRAAYDRVSKRDVSGLTEDQRLRRTERLANLDAYIERSIFPKNTDFAGVRAPYFVDNFGTRCAVAEMVEASGRSDLVARVAGTANNAYVPELAKNPELVAWLEENGLTADEAAMIQPSYEPTCTPKVECMCRNWEGLGYSKPTAIMRARMKAPGDTAIATVLEISGDAPGVALGDDVSMFNVYDAADTELLVVVRRNAGNGSNVYGPNWLIGDGRISCNGDADLTLEVGIAMNALRADDCVEQVIDANPAFDGDVGGGCAGCRCSNARPSPTALWLLLVPLAVSIRRKGA